MTTASSAATGSAGRWGALWGARPTDWALTEELQLPTYEAALARTGLERGAGVLDVGCGAGAFLRLVSERGASASGLDASGRWSSSCGAGCPPPTCALGRWKSCRGRTIDSTS